MNPITETIYNYWRTSRQTRSTPGGWVSGNACCCIHNGETQDTRKRGGVLVTNDGGVVYSCFNCGFSTGWHPGITFGHKLKKFMTWIGIPDDEIARLQFYALSERNQTSEDGTVVEYPEYPVISIPDGIKFISSETVLNRELSNVLKYMASRNLHEIDYPFAYGKKGLHRGRLVIPAYYNNDIVGYITRDVTGKSKSRYIKEIPQGYVFNIDHQNNQREIVFVCEGNLDALYIDGVAVMGSEISEQQKLVINSMGKDVVVVPDRDSKGKYLVKQAIDNGWSVAFPDWESDIKDIGDAVMSYGRLWTLVSIASSIASSKFKIQLNSKIWFGK